MIELLLYASIQKAAPTGEPLTATVRLALMQLILIGKGDAVEVDPERFAPLVGLSHSKSVPRLLKTMAQMELVSTVYPRSKAGRRSFTVCYPLPRIKRKPSNMEVTRLLDPSNIQVTWGMPSNIQALDGQAPGNMEVTRLDPSNMEVTRLNYQARKDLEPPSNMGVTASDGMGIALNTPLPMDITREGGERADPSNMEVTRAVDHPAVRVWVEVMRQDIGADAVDYITSRVLYLDLWRETLQGWKASKWTSQNVTGQVERYLKAAKNYSPPVTETQAKPKDKEEEDRIRSIIYADE
jgi:hypothetical protein